MMAVLRDVSRACSAMISERVPARPSVRRSTLPAVPAEIPAVHFARRAGDDRRGDRRGPRPASPTSRRRTSAGWASGRGASTAATSCS